LKTRHNKWPYSLDKTCVYSEDLVQTNYFDCNRGQDQGKTDVAHPETSSDSLESLFAHLANGVNHAGPEATSTSHVDRVVRKQTLQMLGSFDCIPTLASAFFQGVYQRIPALSSSRFHDNLQSLPDQARNDFLALCLCMHLVQQMPPEGCKSMQTSLYASVKTLIALVEAAGEFTLDVLHCRLLIAFYEMGHGLHSEAFLSIGACARMARMLNIHKKATQSVGGGSTTADEEERTWWIIYNMEHFINLCNAEKGFCPSEDFGGSGLLSEEDLVWLENLMPRVDDSASTLAIGEMMRESQVSQVAGCVVEHISRPISDPNFDAEEAVQLERTLKAFLPLLANKELETGKFCGALGICNRYGSCY
jgi:hypothetical protein